MNLRMHFVTDWQSDCWTMTELCADYQISRKTGYKWVERFETAGPPGCRISRGGRMHSPPATDPALVDDAAWRCGAPSALGRPETAGGRAPPRARDAAWPSRSTVCDLLKARGLVVPRRRRDRPSPAPPSPLAPIDACE